MKFLLTIGNVNSLREDLSNNTLHLHTGKTKKLKQIMVLGLGACVVMVPEKSSAFELSDISVYSARSGENRV